MSLKQYIEKDRLPVHIAVIMDGNGRWAKQKGNLRIFGHQNGVKAVKDTVEAAVELGIQHLTLYAFSTENWNRPALEISALMELLVSSIHKETKTLMDNNVRLNAFGNLSALPEKCRKELAQAIDKTKNNTRLTLHLALSYSSRWEIEKMVKDIARRVERKELKSEDIDEQVLRSALCTKDIPDPELMIRTSGEYRLSNFLLWQMAYTELFFTPVLWPDFRREHLYEAVVDFQKRERRFGKTSEQVM